MNIVVVGPGAVGGYFGGLLVKAGESVTFLAKEAYYALTSCRIENKKYIIWRFFVRITRHKNSSS